MALAVQSTVMTAGRGQAAQLAMLHHRLADPVDAGVVADGVVAGVHKNDLVVLEGGVLVHPIGVEHAEAAELPAGSLLSDGTLVPLELQLSHTLEEAGKRRREVLKKRPVLTDTANQRQTESRNDASGNCINGSPTTT